MIMTSIDLLKGEVANQLRQKSLKKRVSSPDRSRDFRKMRLKLKSKDIIIDRKSYSDKQLTYWEKRMKSVSEDAQIKKSFPKNFTQSKKRNNLLIKKKKD